MSIIDDETRRFGRLLHYAGALILVVSFSTGYSLLHAPAEHAITETTNRIDELMQSVQNAPLIREQHGVVTAKLRDVTTRIANVQRRVPQDAAVVEFMNQLMDLAGAEKLAIIASEGSRCQGAPVERALCGDAATGQKKGPPCERAPFASLGRPTR